MLTAQVETPDIATSSADYARRFSGSVGTWFLQRQTRAVLHMLEGSRGANIIDVGGGHGQLTAGLLRSGHRVTVFGSDLVCRDRIAEHLEQDRCRFEAGSLLDLPFADRSFDFAVSVRLLAHTANWRRLIAELCRVADRAVIVDYPGARSANVLAPRLFGLKRRLEGNTRPFACFWEREILEVFAAHGFARVDRSAQFLMPMVVHRAMCLRPLSAAIESCLSVTGLTRLFGSPVILKLARVKEPDA